jgi:hypothetical protein
VPPGEHVEQIGYGHDADEARACEYRQRAFGPPAHHPCRVGHRRLRGRDEDVTEHGIFSSGNAFGKPRLHHRVAEDADDFAITDDDKMVDAARTHATERLVQRFVWAYGFDSPAHDSAETHTTLAFFQPD